MRSSGSISVGTPKRRHPGFDPQGSLRGAPSHYAIQFPELPDHLSYVPFVHAKANPDFHSFPHYSLSSLPFALNALMTGMITAQGMQWRRNGGGQEGHVPCGKKRAGDKQCKCPPWNFFEISLQCSKIAHIC